MVHKYLYYGPLVFVSAESDTKLLYLNQKALENSSISVLSCIINSTKEVPIQIDGKPMRDIVCDIFRNNYFPE